LTGRAGDHRAGMTITFVVAFLLLALALASPLEAAVYSMKWGGGSLQLEAPVVWYLDPGVPDVNVTLEYMASQARVSAEPDNLALAVADHNGSVGVLAKRVFVKYDDYNGNPELLNYTWRVLGYRLVEDPDGAGILLGEMNISWIRANGQLAYVLVYVVAYPWNDTVHVKYYKNTNNRQGTCEVVTDEWNHTYTITYDLVNDRFNVYIDGASVCSKTLRANERRASTLTFSVGSNATGSLYEVYIDDVNLTVVTSEERITVIDSYEDGIDDVFRDTTYIYSSGASSPEPPPDGSIGLTILVTDLFHILDTATSLPDTTQIPAWLETTLAQCTRQDTLRTLAIRVEETAGVARALAWVNLSLNGSNFQDWDLLAPDGSNIYFSLPDGTVTLHHITSIDTTAKTAVIEVLVPSLPAYSSAHVYMHYGGTSPYQTYVDFTPDTIDGVRLVLLGPLSPVLAEQMKGVNGAWTINETITVNSTPTRPVSSRVLLEVQGGSTPNLSSIILFSAAIPGSDSSCTQHVWSRFLPSNREGVILGINHTVNISGGLSESYVSQSGLGLIAGRSGRGLDVDPDYIHWVYLNLTTGLWQFRYVSGTDVRNASGQVTVVEGPLLNLSAMTWEERYNMGPFVVFVNPYRASQDYNITIVNTRNQTITFTLYPLVDYQDKVKLDIVVAWEDLWWPGTTRALDNYVDHTVRLTIFDNGTARVAILRASGGYLHMFMLNSQLPPFDTVPNIVEKYVNNNYTLDPEDSVIYVKPHGALVTETSGQVWDPVTGTYKNPPLIFYVEIR